MAGDGSNVCQNCVHFGTICTYPPRAQRLRNPSLATARLKANAAEVEYARYRGNHASIAQCFDVVDNLRPEKVAPSIAEAPVSNRPVPVDLNPLQSSGILLERIQTEANTGGSRSRTSLATSYGLAATSCPRCRDRTARFGDDTPQRLPCYEPTLFDGIGRYFA
jgi:hypothetical protein